MNLDQNRELHKEFAEKIITHTCSSETWFSEQEQKLLHPYPFYSSVDLRDSGFKIAPVDCNLYPAGFNNICADDVAGSPPLVKKEVLKWAQKNQMSDPKKIVLLPESHTRNLFYLDHLYTLKTLLENAGFEVKVGWLENQDAFSLKSHSGYEVQFEPIKLQNHKITLSGFQPDFVINNNDFSGGYPPFLDESTTPIIPSHHLGWHSRRKTTHFEYYNELAHQYCEVIGMDPWKIQLESISVENVNFEDQKFVQSLHQKAEQLNQRTKSEYEKRGIQETPYLVLKSDSGTYGMAVTTFQNSEELLQFNRRQKNKMSVGKNQSQVKNLILQEGVPTLTEFEGFAAEPVIYMMGSERVGGFIRTNTEKGKKENLNAHGMVFKKLCMSDLKTVRPSGEDRTLELVYGVVARLASLAAGKELFSEKDFNASRR